MNKCCTYCESDKEPYFSRVEPMGFYCVECGHNFDGVDPEDFKEIKKQLASERALADRLGQSLLRVSEMSPLIYAHVMDDLAAWKEARSE
jgi:C4-type Zn-finger protein